MISTGMDASLDGFLHGKRKGKEKVARPPEERICWLDMQSRSGDCRVLDQIRGLSTLTGEFEMLVAKIIAVLSAAALCEVVFRLLTRGTADLFRCSCTFSFSSDPHMSRSLLQVEEKPSGPSKFRTRARKGEQTKGVFCLKDSDGDYSSAVTGIPVVLFCFTVSGRVLGANSTLRQAGVCWNVSVHLHFRVPGSWTCMVCLCGKVASGAGRRVAQHLKLHRAV